MKASYIKAFFVSIISFLSSLIGILAVPVILMVTCNLIDYITGLIAAPKRAQDINSYKSIRGVMKKISMWLLVVVGAVLDELLIYTTDAIGLSMPCTFLIACVVAVWITCNEIISILENMIDIGVTLPPFLLPIVRHIKTQVEHTADIADIEDETEDDCNE